MGEEGSNKTPNLTTEIWSGDRIVNMHSETHRTVDGERERDEEGVVHYAMKDEIMEEEED